MMTAKEIAEHLKITPMTIYRWRKEGMPAKKFGKDGSNNAVRFELDKVMEWLENRSNE